MAGFSLHAGVATSSHERAKLERLRRYITRPDARRRTGINDRFLLLQNRHTCHPWQ
ncbi:MAG: transposase [Proteobacteria bacterium]|nr:transposase [Pseudomonadota bacterium]